MESQTNLLDSDKVYHWRTKPDIIQYKALRKAIKRGNLGVFFEPRVGKSLVAVHFCGYEHVFNNIRRVLIISPLSVRSVWQEQINLHLDESIPREVILWDPKRHVPSAPKGTLRFIVVTWDQMWRYRDTLAAWKPQIIIADECHRLKNRNTKRSKAAAVLANVAPLRLGLSGTAYTKYEDLFGEFRFIDKNLFGASWKKFRETYLIMGGYMGKQVVGYKNEDLLLQKLAEASVVATREDTIGEPQVDTVHIPVPLEPKAREAYNEMRDELVLMLEDTTVSASIKLTWMLRLLQIAGGFVTADDGTVRQVSKAKLEYCLDLVEDITSRGHKVVIFAKFLPEIQALAAKLPQAVVIHGGVPEHARLDARVYFQDDPDTTVAIVQIDSGGEGVSFAEAHDVIYYSMSYSLTSFLQSEARVLGREQKSNVVNYYFLEAENTLDSKLVERILKGEDFTNMTTEKVKTLLGY